MDNVPSIVPLAVLATRCATVVVASFIELRAVVVYESVSVPDKYKNTPHSISPSTHSVSDPPKSTRNQVPLTRPFSRIFLQVWQLVPHRIEALWVAWVEDPVEA